MEYVNLLARVPGKEDIKEFAQTFFESAVCPGYEERQSSNYAGERYFTGECGTMRFVVAVSDDRDHSDLPFWIQISSDQMTVPALTSQADSLVRSRLIPAGFLVARIKDFGKRTETRVETYNHP